MKKPLKVPKGSRLVGIEEQIQWKPVQASGRHLVLIEQSQNGASGDRHARKKRCVEEALDIGRDRGGLRRGDRAQRQVVAMEHAAHSAVRDNQATDRSLGGERNDLVSGDDRGPGKILQTATTGQRGRGEQGPRQNVSRHTSSANTQDANGQHTTELRSQPR